jgi:hypothetical protein
MGHLFPLILFASFHCLPEILTLSCKSSVKSCLESGECLARGNVFFHLDKEMGLNLKW